MPKKEKLMTEKEFEEFRNTEIPPKRGTSAYIARQAAIQDAKEEQLLEQMKKGYEGAIRNKKGGSVKSKPKSSASKRADGVAKKGKTRGRIR